MLGIKQYILIDTRQGRNNSSLLLYLHLRLLLCLSTKVLPYGSLLCFIYINKNTHQSVGVLAFDWDVYFRW